MLYLWYMANGLNIPVWAKCNGCAQSVVQKKKIQKLQDIAITAEQRWTARKRGKNGGQNRIVFHL